MLSSQIRLFSVHGQIYDDKPVRYSKTSLFIYRILKGLALSWSVCLTFWMYASSAADGGQMTKSPPSGTCRSSKGQSTSKDACSLAAKEYLLGSRAAPTSSRTLIFHVFRLRISEDFLHASFYS